MKQIGGFFTSLTKRAILQIWKLVQISTGPLLHVSSQVQNEQPAGLHLGFQIFEKVKHLLFNTLDRSRDMFLAILEKGKDASHS